jgi:hypothetical protein
MADMLMTLASASNGLWHPMQYVGLLLIAIAIVGLCAPKKDDD